MAGVQAFGAGPVGDPAGQDAGLATARTGQDAQARRGGGHRQPLLVRQPGQEPVRLVHLGHVTRSH